MQRGPPRTRHVPHACRAEAPPAAQEIPTFRAMPLTPKCDAWCEFPVADRPNAVAQFFAAAAAAPALIKAPWILMIETDYVWMAPLQGVPRAESDAPGWAFPYGYIVPTHPGVAPRLPARCKEGRNASAPPPAARAAGGTL